MRRTKTFKAGYLALSAAIAVGVSIACSVVEPVRADNAAYDAAFNGVLANPDDVAVNITFLEAQLAAGDFEGASVTLQRILLRYPNFDEARLIRVAVFLRLGDDAAAQSDLDYLAGRPLTDAQRAEASRLAVHVRSSPTALRFAGVVRAGVLYDSNPGQRPGNFFLSGVFYNFPAADAFGAFGQVELSAEQPIGGQGHSLRAQANVFGRGHFDGGRGHSFARVAVGPRFDLGFAFLDVMAVGGLEFIGGNLYGTDVGGRAQIIADVSESVSASLRVQAVHEAVDVNLLAVTPMGDADGVLVSVQPSLTYHVSTLWSFTVNGLYASKDAGSAWYSYDSLGGGASVRYRNASGVQVQVGGTVRNVQYDALNPFVVPATVARDETRYTASVAVSAPFATILDGLGTDDTGAWANDWSLEAFARYQHNDSNIPVYESDGVSVGLSIARRFSN